MPNIPLEEQNKNDLMWIREEFLDSESHNLPYFVIHGHTPVSSVDIGHDRMNIDTGAYYTGNLSAVLID